MQELRFGGLDYGGVYATSAVDVDWSSGPLVGVRCVEPLYRLAAPETHETSGIAQGLFHHPGLNRWIGLYSGRKALRWIESGGSWAVSATTGSEVVSWTAPRQWAWIGDRLCVLRPGGGVYLLDFETSDLSAVVTRVVKPSAPTVTAKYRPATAGGAPPAITPFCVVVSYGKGDLSGGVPGADWRGWESDPATISWVEDMTLDEAETWTLTDSPTGAGMRVYLPDAAGVYREYGYCGSGGTIWGRYTSRPYELTAEPWVEAMQPVNGSVCIDWQMRLVIADGCRLYLSEIGYPAWRDDSDVLVLPNQITALAVLNGVLYAGMGTGWMAISGSPGAWSTRMVADIAAAPGYSGHGALAAADGRIWDDKGLITALSGLGGWERCWQRADGLDLLMTDGRMAIRDRDAWALLSHVQRPVCRRPSGGWYTATSDGCDWLVGATIGAGRGSWWHEQTIVWRETATIQSVYLDGSGSVQLTLNGVDCGVRTLPALWDGLGSVARYESVIRLDGQAGSVVRRGLYRTGT